MEPSARSYNTNGPGRAAVRAARPGQRSGAASPRKTIAAANRPPTGILVAEQPVAERQGEAPDPVESFSVDVDAPEQEAEHEAAAGPVVGLADFEDIFTRFQTP